MTFSFPTQGSTPWTDWAQAVHDSIHGDRGEIVDLVVDTATLGWTAQDSGFISWTGDPAAMSNGTQPTNGVLYIQAHKIRKPVACVGATVIATAGGTTPTNCYMGLFDSDGDRIAVTADQASSWGTDGVKAPSWTAPVDLSAGTYYSAVLNGGGTSPGLLRNGNTGSGYGGPSNAGLSAPYRFGSIGTGQTSISSSITLGSVAAVHDRTYFVALRWS